MSHSVTAAGTARCEARAAALRRVAAGIDARPTPSHCPPDVKKLDLKAYGITKQRSIVVVRVGDKEQRSTVGIGAHRGTGPARPATRGALHGAHAPPPTHTHRHPAPHLRLTP